MICRNCGDVLNEGSKFCASCGQPVAGQPVQEQPIAGQPAAVAEKKENVFLGIIGALIGACLGAASIILLSQLGYVASLSGVILALCTLKGYELLGKKLSITGVIISTLLLIITPYIADRLDWAIVVVQAWEGEVGLLEAFLYVPQLIREEAIDLGEYLKALGMLYLFVALGGVGTIIKAFKKNK